MSDTTEPTAPTEPTEATHAEKMEPLIFDGWYAAQSDEVRKLVDGHIANLKSAHERVKAERKELKTTLTQIKEAGVSDAVQLKQIQDALAESQRKTLFYEQCPAEVVNPQSAFVLAVAFNCFSEEGKLDLDKFKEACPEQFKDSTPADAHAGAGAGRSPSSPQSEDDRINEQLRAAAVGRKT